MKQLVALLISALLTSGSLAGIVSKEGPTVYMVLLADGTVEKLKEWPKTLEECRARAQAIIPKGSCSVRYPFDNVGTCDDVAKPQWPRELDPNGFVLKPSFRSKVDPTDDTNYTHEVEDFVAAPFPVCWVKGWRVAMAEDLDDGPEELAGVHEPTWITPAQKAAVDTFNAQWQAQQDEDAAACAAGDTTRCPDVPMTLALREAIRAKRLAEEEAAGG